MVATVGRVETRPGAANVIAGEVIATLDVRHAEDREREQAAAELLRAAQREAEVRGVRVESRASATQAAVPMDAALTAQLPSRW